VTAWSTDVNVPRDTVVTFVRGMCVLPAHVESMEIVSQLIIQTDIHVSVNMAGGETGVMSQSASVELAQELNYGSFLTVVATPLLQS